MLINPLLSALLIIILSGLFVIRRWKAKESLGVAAFLLLVSAVTYSAGRHDLARNIGIIADTALIAASVMYIIQNGRRRKTPGSTDEDSDS